MTRSALKTIHQFDAFLPQGMDSFLVPSDRRLPHRPEVTAVVCTHNPRPDHLGPTLASLREQSLSLDQWEFLLVGAHSLARAIVDLLMGRTPMGAAARAYDITAYAPDAVGPIQETSYRRTIARLVGSTRTSE